MVSEWVPIKEAAERLGISSDTVRRRLKRGELAGRQERTAQGFVWQIEVPCTSTTTEHLVTEQGTPDVAGDALELVRLRERVTGLERLTDELKGERDAWKDQASRHEDAARELRILVQQAQSLARALPAEIHATSRSEESSGVSAALSEHSDPEIGHEPSHVAAWLRRLFSRVGL